MMENVDQTVAKRIRLKSLCNLKRRKKAAAGIIIVCWARIRKYNKFASSQLYSSENLMSPVLNKKTGSTKSS